LQREYGANSHIIAYGGDHAINVSKENIDMYNLPANYSFTVCRIEPENNIHIILEAFARMQSEPLIMVGNWNDSEYGRKLRSKYKHTKHTYMLDPIYNLGQLATLRANAKYYIHGHSAGGTNPSLVEAMHFGRPIIAYDCVFNRYTTEEKATYFNSIDSLANILRNPDYKELNKNSREMRKIARKKYTWELVAKQYFELLNAV
ncbi:MAG: glycosyltransferase, partial [Gammaproteobacteria bacterium]|nr:glycosyltransferase [Gammaproteobacteria bacterium]